MFQPRRLLPRVNPQTLKKLLRVKLMLAPHKKMLKLMLMLKEMRREGVEFIALE
jgi:hypothetical protein